MAKHIFIVSDEDTSILEKKINYYLSNFSGELYGTPFAVRDEIACSVIADKANMPDLEEFKREIEELELLMSDVDRIWNDQFRHNYYSLKDNPLNAAMSVVHDKRYDLYSDAVFDIQRMKEEINRIKPLLDKIEALEYEGDNDPIWDEIQE